METSVLRSELAGRVDGDVRFDPGTRAAYAQDASNYRQVPIGVVVPRSVDAAVAAIAVCRHHDVPVLSKSGGTSLAGQCCNEALVIDWTKYYHRVVAVDPAAKTAVVEAGTAILADGFSCRTQIAADHLGRQSIHLAELLAGLSWAESATSLPIR